MLPCILCESSGYKLSWAKGVYNSMEQAWMRSWNHVERRLQEGGDQDWKLVEIEITNWEPCRNREKQLSRGESLSF